MAFDEAIEKLTCEDWRFAFFVLTESELQTLSILDMQHIAGSLAESRQVGEWLEFVEKLGEADGETLPFSDIKTYMDRVDDDDDEDGDDHSRVGMAIDTRPQRALMALPITALIFNILKGISQVAGNNAYSAIGPLIILHLASIATTRQHRNTVILTLTLFTVALALSGGMVPLLLALLSAIFIALRRLIFNFSDMVVQ